MHERFSREIEGHRLRGEIIATQLANSLINRGGPTLLVAARDRTGATTAGLVRAYAAVRDSFGLQDLHAGIEALDGKIAGRLQLDLFAIVQDVLVDRLGWFTRNLEPAAGLADIVARCRKTLDELFAALPSLLPHAASKSLRDTEARLRAGGVPDALATRIAFLHALARSSDVILIAHRAERGVAEAAKSYFAIADRFGFSRIDQMIEEIAAADYYESLALQKTRDSLETAHRELARNLLVNGGAGDVASWEEKSGERIGAVAGQVEKILADRRPSMAKVTVAASLLSELARG